MLKDELASYLNDSETSLRLCSDELPTIIKFVNNNGTRSSN